MGSEDEKKYAEFQEKVKRTVYFDNLSPQVTEPVLKTACEQYGVVNNVHIIPNYSEPFYTSKCALVEMLNEEHALKILNTVSSYPFMMSGMPRPVRARAAGPEMFEDRPFNPNRKIKYTWLDPKDPDFQVAQELKKLAKKHAAERTFLLKKQLEEEEKLSKQQAETLKAHYLKYEMMDSVLSDSTAKRLARHYGVTLGEDNGSFQ